MKYIIWSYKDGKYIDKPTSDGLRVAIEFDTEKEAQEYVNKEASKDVLNGDEESFFDAEEQYLIEDIA